MCWAALFHVLPSACLVAMVTVLPVLRPSRLKATRWPTNMNIGDVVDIADSE